MATLHKSWTTRFLVLTLVIFDHSESRERPIQGNSNALVNSRSGKEEHKTELDVVKPVVKREYNVVKNRFVTGHSDDNIHINTHRSSHYDNQHTNIDVDTHQLSYYGNEHTNTDKSKMSMTDKNKLLKMISTRGRSGKIPNGSLNADGQRENPELENMIHVTRNLSMSNNNRSHHKETKTNKRNVSVDTLGRKGASILYSNNSMRGKDSHDWNRTEPNDYYKTESMYHKMKIDYHVKEEMQNESEPISLSVNDSSDKRESTANASDIDINNRLKMSNHLAPHNSTINGNGDKWEEDTTKSNIFVEHENKTENEIEPSRNKTMVTKMDHRYYHNQNNMWLRPNSTATNGTEDINNQSLILNSPIQLGSISTQINDEKSLQSEYYDETVHHTTVQNHVDVNSDTKRYVTSEFHVTSEHTPQDIQNGLGDVKVERRNVTSLLDFLMTGYDKRIRPGFGGGPVVVKTDIEIRSMGPISEKDMIYSMDCYFRQVWADRRLSFNATQERVNNVTLNVKMLDRIWKPDTIFGNGGHAYKHTITTPNMFFRLSDDGTILYSQRLTIKATCPMHLEKFPMDTQQCPLHIRSFGYPDADVHYEWHYGNQLAAKAATDMRLSQFDLKSMPACNMTRLFKGTVHSVLTVYFDFRRHTGYFLIQVYLPCCLLVILSWVSFWINREATAERISLGATTMLTLTLIVLDTRNDLPKVTYPTALDMYVATCFSFIFASIVQFAAVHFHTKFGTADEDLPRVLETDDEVEDEEVVFLPSHKVRIEDKEIQGCSNMVTCFKKTWGCLMSTRKAQHRFNKHVRSALGLNSVSKIDRMARFIFPAAFSGFNIVYWMAYL